MTGRMTRLTLALLAPLLLASCFLAPGKFTSTLTINADRSFTYAYLGEVYGLDVDQMMKDVPGDKPASTQPAGWQKTPVKPAPDEPKEDKDAANRAMADALSKEAGFRKVEYLGNSKFMIDYQISGKLDHAFLFPYNIDAGIIIPFIAVELRANGRYASRRRASPTMPRIRLAGWAAATRPRRRASSTACSRSTPMPRWSARTTRMG